MKFFIFISLLLSFLFTESPANQEANKTSKIQNILFDKTKISSEKKDISEMPRPSQTFQNKVTMEKYQKSLQSYYDYKIRGFEHRSKVFEWQLFSSRLLFLIVIILVFAGIYFAAVQFHAGLKNKTLDQESTSINISSKNIEISSPIVGIIILALSLGFFYLYLVYVYPIEEIF